jgi:hypothetical protein
MGTFPRKCLVQLAKGVDASFPQNVRKLQHFYLYKTTVIHKLCNADYEARLNLWSSTFRECMLEKSIARFFSLMMKIGIILCGYM